MTNDRHYYTDGEDQLWRVEPGEAPPPVHRGRWLAALEIWGMGIASQDLTGDGLPEVFLTSQGDNKLQTLAGGPPADVRGHRPPARRHGPPAVHGRRRPPLDRMAHRIPGREQRRVHRPVRLQGQREAQPDSALRDPNNLLLGRPDGTFIESARAAGIVEYVRGRGAAVVDLNLDGLLDLVQVNRRVNVSLWRNASF